MIDNNLFHIQKCDKVQFTLPPIHYVNEPRFIHSQLGSFRKVPTYLSISVQKRDINQQSIYL